MMYELWIGKIVSLNVSGLNTPVKRRLVNMLIAEQADLLSLQETHLRVGKEKYLKEVFRGLIYHAPTHSRSKGIMLGISK